MAYQYVKATGRLRERNAVWSEIEVGNVTLLDVYRLYERVILELSHPILSGPQYFDLLAHRPLVNGTLTVNAWLALNGDSALVTKITPPMASMNTAVFMDAALANYSFGRVNPLGHPTSNSTDSNKTDLLLTRGLTDYMDFADHCVVTVNGMLHRTEGSEYGVYVRDGWLSGMLSSTNVGILSFKNVCKIKTIPITPTMLKNVSGDDLLEEVYITLPEAIGTRTPLLVLGGYLHALDGSYHLVGDQAIKVKVSELDITQRIWDNVSNMYMGDLLDPFRNGNATVDTYDLTSNDTIAKFLTLSQSFIVLLETTERVVVNKTVLENCELPGRYIADYRTVKPLFNERGRLLSYWPTKHFDKYILSVTNNTRNNYRYQTTDWRRSEITEGVLESNRPTDFALGYLLTIGVDAINF